MRKLFIICVAVVVLAGLSFSSGCKITNLNVKKTGSDVDFNVDEVNTETK